ncbi:MAG: type II toxin-antitoxin system VapC family toxin [Propionibacteriaceae bacterium]|jgi:PIN domain nuclease of toxin-antitoxin system|nr:type II toxin-antitoxin system VapC family toxin [Propionibacteriaceae bacterium]
MRLLLDTNILIRWVQGHASVSQTMRGIVQDPQTTVYVSSVSAAEIAIKTSIGKLPPFPRPVASILGELGFTEMPFTVSHGDLLATLPWHHRDPFDRMLIAQALSEGLPIATVDRAFASYGIQVVV